MVDHYRLIVQKRLAALIEAIVPVNDVHDFTLMNAVFRGRMLFGDADPLPMVSIIEAARPDPGVLAGTNKDTRSEKWALVVQGWVKNDPANPTDPAYNLMAAVETQLGRILANDPKTGLPVDPVNYMLGAGDAPAGRRTRLINSFDFGPGVVSPPRDQVSTQAFFFLPVWIGLAETVGQPYLAV